MQPDILTCRVNELASLADLGKHWVEEFLATKTRLDCHEEDLVKFSQDVGELFDWGCRAQSYRRPCSHRPKLTSEFDWRGSSFQVEGDRLRSRLDVLPCPPIGIFDHEVNVKHEVSGWSQRFHEGRPHDEIRYEMAIHDVDV